MPIPRCRVYLFTYNRDSLLPRAVESLLKQTCTNWVCEVHNDLPSNPFPGNYIAGLNDDRFIIKNHENNLGAIRSFNIAFDDCDEDYVSILEDDNWWEPEFLQTMIATMDEHRLIQVAWANMNLWQEGANNQWVSLNKTIWPLSGDPITHFRFPQYKQAFSALHSNGAMLVRNGHLSRYKTPENIRFDFVEQIRERSFPHPVLLVNKVLANFSQTLVSNRPKSSAGTIEHYFLLLASFFKYSKEGIIAADIWTEIRKSPVKATHNLLYAGLIDKNCRELLKYANAFDWLFFIAYNIKHPCQYLNCLRAKQHYKQLWNYLDASTATRLNELM